MEIPPFERSRFREGGVYFILGGAGRLGFKFSRYLAANFRAKLIWVGRRPLNAEIEADAGQIRQDGGDVLYLQARGDDLEQMRAAFEAAQHRFGSLNGVIHSTLVFQDEPLRTLSEDFCREILNSKVKTAAVLAELTRALPLDFLLFFGLCPKLLQRSPSGGIRRWLLLCGCLRSGHPATSQFPGTCDQLGVLESQLR
jgi:NAD(P)-dependent dehydrogenase (short-subunit alcohol dehydrogenase family)